MGQEREARKGGKKKCVTENRKLLRHLMWTGKYTRRQNNGVEGAVMNRKSTFLKVYKSKYNNNK